RGSSLPEDGLAKTEIHASARTEPLKEQWIGITASFASFPSLLTIRLGVAPIARPLTCLIPHRGDRLRFTNFSSSKLFIGGTAKRVPLSYVGSGTTRRS